MSGALGVAGTLAGRQARAPPLQLGTRVFDARDTQSHTNNLISRLTTPRPLRSSPPSQRQAARVFLERSPFVPWAQQRPAFVHPAFTGVVHPDLPLWSGVSDPPPEPRPESRSSLPRVARLTTLEARDQPCFHVQTISAARCLSEDDARRKIIAAATHGAAALLLVSGDALADADARRARPSTRPRPRPRESSTSSLDSLALLSVASRARSAGDIPPDTILGCVANPSLDGADGVARLDAKISAGAAMCVTQPSLSPSRHRAWRAAVADARLLDACALVQGVHIATSAVGVGFWHRLAGVEDHPEAIAERVAFRRAANHLDAETFRAWVVERAELAAAEALANGGDARGGGVHVMPVTADGYAAAAKLADSLQTLAGITR